MADSILVTGGAGYIGSHTVRHLQASGYKVVVLDNMVYGHEEAVLDRDVQLVKGDLNDEKLLAGLFKEQAFTAVVHFAAYAYVGESIHAPQKYYLNNVVGSLNLLKAMNEYKCRNFVFSSTCATYGNPQYTPMDENHPQDPINPYGMSKLMLERIVRDYHRAYGLNYVFLRYFNACGTSFDGKIGEDHDPETHLIPLVIRAVQNPEEPVTIFGEDYDTPDGTCIRDYIHVEDLADAHVMALDSLLKGGESIACNLGTGTGNSVKEVISMVEKVTGQTVPVKTGERRAGDPARLIANPGKAKELLGWQAKYTLEDSVRTAWNWFSAPHNGRYGGGRQL